VAIHDVADYGPGGWVDPGRADARSRACCERLERGEVVLLRSATPPLADADREFLLSARQAGSSYFKNISYRPGQDRVKGVARGTADVERLRAVLSDYSRRITALAGDVLRPYARGWALDFASFRSIEEEGRPGTMKTRNDLLHVDAFPTRPTNGRLILRVFTNLNPSRVRVWMTGPPFETVAREHANRAGLAAVAARAGGAARRVRHAVTRGARSLGVALPDRSPYDEFMHDFHHYLKGSREFQDGCTRERLEFPPGATWMVFTDVVPHAVLSGQFAVEQTFIVPPDALVTPARAPVRVLERLCGASLTN
jgi:hypothetical protein